MSHVIVLSLGVAAGLHAALYGAWKDSPHESFMPRRFVRELVIAAAVTAFLVLARADHGQSMFVLYLSAFALSRIVTEFWKLFLRVEPQGAYRIPTQIHWFTRVVHAPVVRALIGLAWLAGTYGMYALFTLLPDDAPRMIVGLVVGGGIGLAIATCGAYKDGSIEGFSPRKFAKSPTFGALGGLFAACHTTSLPFLLLASVGTERMANELLFKVLVPGYVPGKFRSMTARFPVWMERRHVFLGPYAVTWALYVLLFSVGAFKALPFLR